MVLAGQRHCPGTLEMFTDRFKVGIVERLAARKPQRAGSMAYWAAGVVSLPAAAGATRRRGPAIFRRSAVTWPGARAGSDRHATAWRFPRGYWWTA